MKDIETTSKQELIEWLNWTKRVQFCVPPYAKITRAVDILKDKYNYTYTSIYYKEKHSIYCI